MLLTYLMLAVALCLSAVAAFYSIAGLTAIFAAAVIPIVIMGSILEVAKLVVTVWLHEYWDRIKFTMKAYLVPAVLVLMLLTSMGIFGFLSKAHMDQTLVSGDVTSQLALFDERIKIEKENIDANRKILVQLDQQVDQVLSRSTDERGARGSAALRKGQAQERKQAQAEILSSQTKIQQLNEERAPIAAQVRDVEAEVGPVKYIAAMIYGDNPDANLLERAVRWVIIVLVVVFDPLAVIMLLAFTESIKWDRDDKKAVPVTEPDIDTVFTNGEMSAGQPAPVFEDFVDDFSGAGKGTQITTLPDAPWLAPDPAIDDQHEWPAEKIAEFEAVMAEYDNEPVTLVAEQPITESVMPQEGDPVPLTNESNTVTEPAEDAGSLERPGDYLQEPALEIDTVVEFGTEFPPHPTKGAQFVLTGRAPTQLYKYNGDKWIMVDKDLTDQYTYNQSYINYLIDRIASGDYDPELLTDAERLQIQTCLGHKN